MSSHDPFWQRAEPCCSLGGGWSWSPGDCAHETLSLLCLVTSCNFLSKVSLDVFQRLNVLDFARTPYWAAVFKFAPDHCFKQCQHGVGWAISEYAECPWCHLPRTLHCLVDVWWPWAITRQQYAVVSDSPCWFRGHVFLTACCERQLSKQRWGIEDIDFWFIDVFCFLGSSSNCLQSFVKLWRSN